MSDLSGSITEYVEDLWDGLARHGILTDAFDFRGQHQTDCPYCGAKGSMVLSRSTFRAKCTDCSVDAKLSHFVDRLDRSHLDVEEDKPLGSGKSSAAEADMLVQDRISADKYRRERAKRSLARNEKAKQQAIMKAERKGRIAEKIIMSLLALIFLGAGLAAAILSGFANFQAFSASVTDPMQSSVWGWSGVIASICSFGGFTFFWWHMNAKRWQEAVRAFVFALAGAGTSIAGTALFMEQNSSAQIAKVNERAQAERLVEAEISDIARQLDGIPATTRTVEGLENYLSGVELAGRTHQKPYRDAQNELGLAKRRDVLEGDLAQARARLRVLGETHIIADEGVVPPIFFAVMLEIFSSQGTSIAFVTLLLLFGRRPPPVSPASP